jgi:AraC-like DNA-binding protein
LLEWHELRLIEAAPAWSPEYRPASARLLLPRTRWVECELQGRRILCDPLSAVWLTPARSYRLRQPWRGQRSVVLVVRALEDDGLDSRHDGGHPGRMRHHRAPAATPLPERAAWWLARWDARLSLGAKEQTLALEEEVATFLSSVISACTTAGRGPHVAVERARELLNTDPAANLTLAQVAAASGCSAFHLAHCFRRQTGSTLHAYRTRLRMTQALQRLAAGERDITALALDLGYSSHSHFSAVFRRCLGAAPSTLRTNLTAPRAH